MSLVVLSTLWMTALYIHRSSSVFCPPTSLFSCTCDRIPAAARTPPSPPAPPRPIHTTHHTCANCNPWAQHTDGPSLLLNQKLNTSWFALKQLLASSPKAAHSNPSEACFCTKQNKKKKSQRPPPVCVEHRASVQVWKTRQNQTACQRKRYHAEAILADMSKVFC